MKKNIARETHEKHERKGPRTNTDKHGLKINTKHEARNSKQIQNSKVQNPKQKLTSDLLLFRFPLPPEF
jgi:hypothetical protein